MNSKPALLIKRLSELAKIPVKGSEKAAGYDLCSAEETKVPAKGKALVKTGISIGVPPGNYGRVGNA
jgi:dUTPase